jgi:UDP-N-acetylmuramate--alanine ligase
MKYLISNVKKIYFIGIGGIGVSALAQWLFCEGYHVFGSDLKKSDNVQRLQGLGIPVHIGDDGVLDLHDVDLLVYSSAVRLNHPDIVSSMALGIPIVKRGQLLAEIANQHKLIAVAGTHGKTTTTSLIAHMFRSAGIDSSFIVGGVLCGDQSPIYKGTSDYMIIESDESDGSFLFCKPHFLVVTNIDRDHLNNYDNDFELLIDAFLQLINSVPDDGLVVLNKDDAVIASILNRITSPFITFGFSSEADVRIMNYSASQMISRFSLSFSCDEPSELSLPLPGQYNVSNAAAASIILQQVLARTDCLAAALASFPGVHRRFSYIGQKLFGAKEVFLVEDYGHHPKAIASAMEAAKQAWSTSRLMVVFQPHRFSRTQDLLDEFARALLNADVVVLLKLYSAGEQEIPGADSLALFRLLEKTMPAQVFLLQDSRLLSALLEQIVQPDDLLLFQGAGSVGALAKQLLEY